jgi:hypothetical protein
LKLIRLGTRAPLVQIDISLFADQIGVSATDTLDFGQGVHDLPLSVDIGVQQTQDVLTHELANKLA